MKRNGKVLGGLLLIVLSAGRTRADDLPAQKAPPGGKPAVAAGVPTVEAKDVIGLHLVGLAVTPAQPRSGCPVTIAYFVENRGLASERSNVEYRTRLVAGGRELVDRVVNYSPSGTRLPVRVPNVSAAPGAFRIEATLTWRLRSRNPVTGAVTYSGPENRLDLAAATLNVPLRGSGPC